MTLKQKVEGNPVFTSLTIIAIIAAAITGLGTITGAYDASHTSEAELVVSHPVQQSQVDAVKVLSVCSTLDIRIAMVEEQIYQMEVSGTNSPRLVEKKRDLRKMEQQYRTLNCASLLK